MLVLTGIVSVQVGAGLAATLFAVVPAAAVTGLRLWTAALLMAVVGGRGLARAVHRLVTQRAWADAAVAVAFGLTLAVMNYSIYQAFARIPLGVAVTVEFLGPLAVAVATSRRLADVAWVVLAGLGVALLTQGGDTAGGRAAGLNLTGLAFALAAGAAWAAYILLSSATGRRFPGSSGLTIAMVVAALAVTPAGVAAGGRALLRPGAGHRGSHRAAVLDHPLLARAGGAAPDPGQGLRHLDEPGASGRRYGRAGHAEPAAGRPGVGRDRLRDRGLRGRGLEGKVDRTGCCWHRGLLPWVRASRYPPGRPPLGRAGAVPDRHLDAPDRTGRGRGERGNHHDRRRRPAELVRARLPGLADLHPSSLVAARTSGDPIIHTYIEFTNRMLTGVLMIVAVLVLITAWRFRPAGTVRRGMVWLAAAQPLGVIAQAVLGGIVVLTDLNPTAVSLHFLLSSAVLALAVTLYARCTEAGTPPTRLVRRELRVFSVAVVPATALMLAAGTVVTGTGPLAGPRSCRTRAAGRLTCRVITCRWKA